jgi:hypothetical protein
MRSEPFTRPTVIAAAKLLDQQTHAEFDTMVLRLALEADVPDGAALSVPKKSNIVARVALQRPQQVVLTLDGNVTSPRRSFAKP